MPRAGPAAYRPSRRRAAALRGVLAPLAPVLLTLWLGGAPAAARPLQLEDLLQRESFGQIALAPGGRWLLVEQRGPIAAARRFDHGAFNPLFRTQLMAADLAAGQPLRPLIPPEPGVGYQAGPISPDGAQVAIYRLSPDRWELGVARFATGEVRWLGVTPEVPGLGRTVQWRSADDLLVIALAAGALPYDLRAARPQSALPALWAATARGATAVTAVGSGRLAAASPTGAPKQLLSVSAATGAARRLAAGDFVDLELAPGGDRLALLEAAEPIPLVADRPVQGAYGLALRRLRLRLLDLRTGVLTAPCPRCDLLATLLSWSPDGAELLAYAREDVAPWRDGRLLRVAAATGAARRLEVPVAAALETRPERVFAGWWGDTPLLFGHPRAAAAAAPRDDWYALSAGGPVRLTGALRHPPRPEDLAPTPGALLAAADGAAWRLTPDGRARHLSAERFAPLAPRHEGIPDRTSTALATGRTLAGRLGADGAARAARVDAAGRVLGPVRISSSETVLIAGRDGALLQSSDRGAERLVWRGRAGDTALAEINGHLAAIDPMAPIAIPHRGPQGEVLRSWLFLPPTPAGGPPPPLVVVPYPGARLARPPALRDQDPMAPAGILLGHGYAVLLPSLPNPPPAGGPAAGLAARVLAIVDAAAAQPEAAGRFDPQRLALWGHSFGAFGTLAILTQTGRFRAAVAVAGRYDFISAWGQFSPARRVFPDEGLTTPWSAGWMETLQGAMGAPPWAASERYLANSPLLQADRITTPVLLATGELDGSHLGQAEEMFSALYRQGKDAILRTYWGEGHLFGSPGNLRDLYARGLGFLDKQLVDRPADPQAQSAPLRRITAPPRPEPGSASGAPRLRRRRRPAGPGRRRAR